MVGDPRNCPPFRKIFLKNKVQSSENLENHMGKNSFEALSKESAAGSPNQEQANDNL